MKAICDVHISYQLVKFLCERGIETIHVNSLPQKSETPDAILAEYADEHDMVLITKDEDFKNSHLVKSKPAKLIRITLGNISNKDLVEIFDKNLLLIISKMKEPICFIEIGKSIITYQK